MCRIIILPRTCLIPVFEGKYHRIHQNLGAKQALGMEIDRNRIVELGLDPLREGSPVPRLVASLGLLTQHVLADEVHSQVPLPHTRLLLTSP